MHTNPIQLEKRLHKQLLINLSKEAYELVRPNIIFYLLKLMIMYLMIKIQLN